VVLTTETHSYKTKTYLFFYTILGKE